ncbi:hypothetical protein [Lewinella sp. W8]|uniref:hypothetical protein n=1 Tax=Lewinella sp. W8 TaxID=2528208 RepID=UPI001067E2E4|nr:hypothetical protein [Lewinella sp. W8]MTB53489.1 hypothetical protein [Lewinella sp. W8]
MEYEKVSLGFAEFTAKLIEESFEAILSSQQYQIERYLRLTESLDADEPISGLVKEEEVDEEIRSRFGSLLSRGMVLSNEESDRLAGLPEPVNLPGGERINAEGEAAIRAIITDLVYERKTEVLRTMINQSALARIHVTEGELETKLELSNLIPRQEEPPVTKKTASRKAQRKVDLGTVEQVQPGFSMSDPRVTKVNLKRIKDPDTGAEIVVVDRNKLLEASRKTAVASVPDLRLIAKPATNSSSSSILATLKIKFKTV